jgi:hypothetical protein
MHCKPPPPLFTHIPREIQFFSRAYEGTLLLMLITDVLIQTSRRRPNPPDRQPQRHRLERREIPQRRRGLSRCILRLAKSREEDVVEWTVLEQYVGCGGIGKDEGED